MMQQPWEQGGKDRFESGRSIIDRTWSQIECGREGKFENLKMVLIFLAWLPG